MDPALDSLLHLHDRKKFAAPNGGNGDPVKGSGGPLSRNGRFQQQTPPFKIGVPPGTVVKRKKGGQQLGELINIGRVQTLKLEALCPFIITCVVQTFKTGLAFDRSAAAYAMMKIHVDARRRIAVSAMCRLLSIMLIGC